MENGVYFQSAALDYTDGEKYPHLEREAGKLDLLAGICRPRATK